jgi:antitoxin StbD
LESQNSISIDQFSKNPMKAVEVFSGSALCVTQNGKPAFNCVMPNDFEAMMELLDDAELNARAQDREAGHFVDIDLNEL